jgi:hypothetical protein
MSRVAISGVCRDGLGHAACASVAGRTRPSGIGEPGYDADPGGSDSGGSDSGGSDSGGSDSGGSDSGGSDSGGSD